MMVCLSVVIISEINENKKRLGTEGFNTKVLS